MTGQTIFHYKILEKLGQGGMGVVYKALDTKLNRTVALKFLPLDLTRDQEAIDRFINEAQAASSLDHPNICTIHEISETEDGQMYICMAYYAGETLQQKVANGQLSVDSAIGIALQAAQGLERAHEAGIIHRDIKPSNLIITTRGEVKIIDFGIAKLAGQARLTKTGKTLGTVAYMSPEQVQKKPVDQRTDIWSLGVVLYEMLTGRLPFYGENEAAVIYSIVNETLEPVQKHRPELSPEFLHVLNHALERNPADRYQSVSDVLSDCRRLKESGFLKSDAETKTGYVPEYENDIFISYAHLDDKPLSEGRQGWISSFHQALEVRLEQLLGADTRIRRDDNLQSKTASRDTSLAPFLNAAVMVVIVSPQYVKSESCIQEVKEFCQAAERNDGLWIDNKARVFKAVKTHVPRKSQPEELIGLPAYEFYQIDTASGQPLEFRHEFGAEADRNFWAKLEDISQVPRHR